MTGSKFKGILLLSFVALVLGATGCGSGSAGNSEPSSFQHSASHDDSGGGAKQFESEGGDNSIQEFGEEAPSSEFDEAAAALHGYLDARAARDWAGACEHLGSSVAAQFSQLAPDSEGKESSCAKLLAALSAGVSASSLRHAAVADVGSFRVEGESGFLLFHGAQGADYFTPMVRQDGAWKVAAIAPSALG